MPLLEINIIIINYIITKRLQNYKNILLEQNSKVSLENQISTRDYRVGLVYFWYL